MKLSSSKQLAQVHIVVWNQGLVSSLPFHFSAIHLHLKQTTSIIYLHGDFKFVMYFLIHFYFFA